MRKVNYLIMLIVCLSFVQCKSNEDKANELIDEYMFNRLYDYESYQPIETNIDSAFHTIYNDSTAISYAKDILFHAQKLIDMDEARHKRLGLSSWRFMYAYKPLSTLSIHPINWADSVNAFYVANATQHLISLYDTIDNEFIGWEVTHKFRCKSKGGYYDISHYVFLIDKDFKTILSTMDLEDEDVRKVFSTISECVLYSYLEEDRTEIKEILHGLQGIKTKYLSSD